MGWRRRFWYSRKLFPGIRINLSKSGPSITLGPRGAKVTLGHGKLRETVGIPHTGLWWARIHSLNSPEQGSRAAASSDTAELEADRILDEPAPPGGPARMSQTVWTGSGDG